MTVDELNMLVTEAILRADALADLDSPTAAEAYLEVSLIEERLAVALPASDVEGAIARRGAVRAADIAGEHDRARDLATRYLAEEDGSPELREEIMTLIDERERSFGARYPHVAARFGLVEIARVTRALVKQGAPFPVG
ncbi:MAG TPA: hypothetical protein VHZ31_06390 [Solirubrobacteraceae bacterium]|jgi:hypothetical protein|nr:hypothetical protein [Solirubrobacteraceae bacterium]